MLPSNPYTLLSVINTYLRDKYDSLDELVSDLDCDKEFILKTLGSIEYSYNKDKNQFTRE